MIFEVFNKIITDVKKSRYSGLFVVFLFAITTLVTIQIIQSPLFRRLTAQEVTIPEGYTALQYLEAIEQSDVNSDGIVNLFDYAHLLEADYGKAESLVASDVNFDSRANAVDASFMIDNFYLDIHDEREKLYASAEHAAEINKEIAQRNEDQLPDSTIGEEITIASGGESDEQFGRNIIPQVLGTVSAYSGAATFDFPIELPAGPGGFAPSLGISYNSSSIDDARNNGSHGGTPFYKDGSTYTPFKFGYGFSLSGVGSIMRDTQKVKDAWKIEGEVYHRYILSLPGGVSTELEYNPRTGRWVSLPQAFLSINHPQPGKNQVNNLMVLDANEWVITAKDGTKYFFGEKDLGSRIESSGKIKGSQDFLTKNGDRVDGSTGGNLYVEFDRTHLCKGNSAGNPCSSRDSDGKGLMVTKWLLRRVVAPDGKAIEYSYDVHQYRHESPWKDTGIHYVTSSSYPKEIRWNEGKHQVTFVQEDRRNKGHREYMRSQMKEIIVETKAQATGKYEQVRKYILGYYDNWEDEDEAKEQLGVRAGEEDTGIHNGFKASFLTSIQEIGTDNSTSLPPITFKYLQYRFPPQGYHGGEIYLSKINNGYGGETRFAYQAFEAAAFTTSYNYQGRLRRVRVVDKKVSDLTSPDRSYRETYNYHGTNKAYAETFYSGENDKVTSGTEFLGHGRVEIKRYDFDGGLLSHTDSFFHQSNEREECIEAHPAKGRPYRQVVYRGEGNDVAQETLTRYRYRLGGKDLIDPTQECDGKSLKQPYFLYSYDTTSTIREPVKVGFVPSQFTSQLQEQPKGEMRTLQRTLSHDTYGNPTLAVSYGEVDQNGFDINGSDNRYQHSHYLTDGPVWIKGLPYLTYSSNKEDCGKDDLSCQWGRSKMYYDNFEKSYKTLSWEEQQPRYGYLTQQESFINDSEVVGVSGFEYEKLTLDPDDKRRGGITKTYGPKPNVKTVSDLQNDIVLISETKYDPYYHSLVVEEKNGLGHRSLYEDYDVLLQAPRRIRNQLNVSPELFGVTRMEFDPMGRLTATFMTDPENPGFALENPASITKYFENGNDGLVVRSASLASQNAEGFHYQISDTFYDGLGQVKQSQILKTRVNGQDVRKVSESNVHADGQMKESYEVQTTNPVDLGRILPNNYTTILESIQPELASVPKVVNGRTEYDVLRRPISSTQIETGSGQTYTTLTEYMVNAAKTTEPKGVQRSSITDVWGRTIHSFNRDASGEQALMTTNEFGKPMIDKATKTAISDVNGTSSASDFDYDKSGRLISSNDPSLGPYQFEYDVLGNKIFEKSQPREDVGYEYDQVGRLVKKELFSKTDGDPYKRIINNEITYTYDSGNNALGQLVKVRHFTGEQAYEYDGGQRLVKSTTTIFDKTKSFTSEFNKLSQELKSQYPDGSVVEYQYDREGNVAKMLLDGNELLTGSVYDKFGNVTNSTVRFNNATYLSQSNYDNLGRVKGIQIDKEDVTLNGPFTSNLLKQDLTYNSSAEIERLVDRLGRNTNTFAYTYDGFSQLKTVNSDLYNTSYDYDLFGRILKKNEKEEVTLAYNNEFPFYAPKSVSVTGEEHVFAPEPSPTVEPTREPIDEPTTGPEPTQALTPSASPTPATNETPTPIPTNPLGNVRGIASWSFDIPYTAEGAMRSDDRHCFHYNRESELIKLGVKKAQDAVCTDDNFSKIFYFYYDHGGTLNLQEEYSPSDLNNPLKGTYFFGNYEEEVDYTQ